MIQEKCDVDSKWLPVKECALEVHMEICPDDGSLLQMLGSSLSKAQKFAEGVLVASSCMMMPSSAANKPREPVTQPSPQRGG